MGNVKLPIESGKYFKERTEFVIYLFIKKKCCMNFITYSNVLYVYYI